MVSKLYGKLPFKIQLINLVNLALSSIPASSSCGIVLTVLSGANFDLAKIKADLFG